MKITAFILSILLSTSAMAENPAGQYSYVDLEEVQQAMTDGEVIDVEDKSGIVESVESAIGRELTEEEKDSIFSSIDELEAAHSEANHQDSISKYSEECLECVAEHGIESGSVKVASEAVGIMLGLLASFALITASGIPSLVVTAGVILLVGGGSVVGTAVGNKFLERIFSGAYPPCARVCSSKELYKLLL